MSDATQYQFDLTEVATLLIKKQGLTSGRWTVGVNFNIAAMVAGPSPDTVRPSMVVSVDKIVLTRAEGPEAGPLTFDAATI